MNRKVIVLAVLLCVTTPLISLAAEIESSPLKKAAVTAAAGAAIGSVWPGPGTAIGFVVGGIYGFFFR